MDNIAIKVTDVEKVYKLYDKPSDRIKEALGSVSYTNLTLPTNSRV